MKAVILALAAALPYAEAITLGWDIAPTGEYSLTVDSAPWYASPSLKDAPPQLCVGGQPLPLTLTGADPSSGTDSFGDWTGTTLTLSAPTAPSPTLVTHTFKAYAALPSLVVGTAAFPSGVGGAEAGACSGATRTAFPQFNTSAAFAPTLGTFSWRGAALDNLPAAVSLGALMQNSLDSGPVVSFFKGRPGVPHPALVWSTLSSHKIITQATVGAPAAGDVPAPLTALWSAERSEQVLCLSPQCAQEQVADGAYAPARVEGYGFATTAAHGSACANGLTVPTTPLSVAWAPARSDNCVAPTGTPPPSAGYEAVCDNGFIVAAATAGSVAGTVPLYSFNRTYNSTHWDYAAVASAEGLAWAAGAGYTRGALLGYVYAAPPTPCAAPTASSGTYTMGLAAAVPAIPAGWEYSVIFSAADGGPTAAVYAWGDALRGYFGTSRLPSVTLSDIGYYTDDGCVVRCKKTELSRLTLRLTASSPPPFSPPPPVVRAYYYVWEAFNIPARPWPAEEGMVLVKEDLYARGVPIGACVCVHVVVVCVAVYRGPSVPYPRRTQHRAWVLTLSPGTHTHLRALPPLHIPAAYMQLDDWCV
jgi:hypothetical protein